MQKVIRRTLLAERQAARRTEKRKAIKLREWAKTNREQTNYALRDVKNDLVKARQARREDWELGPLAPKRDVGDYKEKYGTISTNRLTGPELERKDIDKALETVGGKHLHIVTGDRVVILEGRDKGRIGKVKETSRERAEVTVEGLNMIDVAVPKWMINADESDKRPIRSMEQPVPITSVRLVYPLPHPETGVVRDVIIKKMVNSKVWYDKTYGRISFRRIVPGLNITIPWPQEFFQSLKKEYTDFPGDTLRMEVEAKTFVPTLLTPPMPGSVIDELRNRYSIFRTRHDPEYIAAKMAEDAEAEAKKKVSEQMRTPLKEANRKLRKERKAKGKGTLTPEMLEKIGKIIASKRQLALGAAGMSTA